MSVLMAVDVGGSGLRAVVRRDGADGPVRRAPGARIGAAGLDVSALVASTRALLPPGSPPDVLVFAARGIIALAGPERVLAALRDLGAHRTIVCSDVVSSLVGALGGVRPGAVVAAGTGVVAFGTDFAGHHRRVDGWGHVLGDRGSAAWIGLAALRSVLRERDLSELGGRPSALLAAAEAHFGPAADWPRLLMTRPDAPELLAGFAPVVTAMAGAEPMAAGICRRAGDSLAESLLAAAHGLAADAPLRFTGGVLEAAAVREPLLLALRAAGRSAEPAAGGSLSGSLLLARRLAPGPDAENTGGGLASLPKLLLIN